MNESFGTTAPCNGTDCPGSVPPDHATGSDDATWILTSAFITFTMQSGFGLLESGSVSTKNEVNIMVKNASDVLFGGLTYWIFGYAFSFGESPLSNSFCGIGQFFVDADEANMGWIFSRFFFQMSFATTATTIVSGAMAERTNLMAYILFCMLNTFIFCFPAHWVWDSRGWLRKMGSVDIAGAGPVHLVGGTVSLVATLMLGPRYKRFDAKDPLKTMACPTNALLGMFMLWWGWLGFNCGSTFGITGGKWKLSARSAVATITSSMAGGIVGLLLSYTTTRMFEIPYLLNGVLGSLVSVTGICALAHPWEGLFIGAVGALIACGSTELLERWQIDDPVGAVPVHFSCAVWSLISIGIFGRIDTLENASQFNGLIAGGGFYLLGIQVLAAASQIVWTIITSYLVLKLVDVVVGLRVPLDKEILGADYCEHGVGEPDRDTPEGASDKGELHDNDSPCRGVHFLGHHADFRHEHNHHHYHPASQDGDTEVVDRRMTRRHSGGYCGHSFRQKHRIRLPKAPTSCCRHCCQCQCHRYEELQSDFNDSESELDNENGKGDAVSCCRPLLQRSKKRQGAKEHDDLQHSATNLKDVATNTISISGSLNVVSQEIVTGL